MSDCEMNETKPQQRPLALFGALVILLPLEALAASSQSTGQNTFGTGLFIVWAIAYLSRRRAIGGWLLFFYIQLYFSFLFSLLILPTTLANLRPDAWDSSKLYVLYIISTAPVLLLMAAEVYAATKLLVRRTEPNMQLLRKILLTLAVVSAIALGIDLSFFKEAATLYFDVVTLVFAIIWIAYFHKAKRVRLVFIENAWNYSVYAPKRILTPEDKRRLRRRVVIASSTTFVILLIIMGLTLGEKKPDAGIFFVPFFYAAIAALIAWYQPLRKPEVEARPDSEPNKWGRKD